MSVHKISEEFFVTGQVSPSHIQSFVEMGIKSIICNRPDGEGLFQPAFSKVEKAALDAGLTAHYLPVSPGAASAGDAKNLADILKDLNGPVLAYCASGNRAANLWNMCQTIGN